MRKAILLFVSFLICLFSLTQGKKTNTIEKQTIQQKDSPKVKIYFWKIRLPDSLGLLRRVREGFFYNETPIGVWVEKNSQNKIYSETIYLDTLEDKVQKNEYFNNGTLKSSGFLHFIPTLDSFPVSYNPEKKKYDYEKRNKIMVKNGKWNYFYENGNIESQGVFVDDKKTGKWKYYNENGELLKTEDN